MRKRGGGPFKWKFFSIMVDSFFGKHFIFPEHPPDKAPMGPDHYLGQGDAPRFHPDRGRTQSYSYQVLFTTDRYGIYTRWQVPLWAEIYKARSCIDMGNEKVLTFLSR